MPPLNILHLADERWDSGLTAYALRLARLQAAAGDHVAVGVLRGKKPEALARALGLATLPIDGFGDLRAALRARTWDVVNAHTGSAHTRAVVAARWLGAGARAAVVRTRGDARELKLHPLARLIYRSTAGVIAVSDHVARQYAERLGLGSDRLRTVYPGIDAPATPPPLSGATVGIVGRLDPVKGHAPFLEAAALVLKARPDAYFLIAGKEAGVSISLLRNQARELGIERSVEFLGHVPSVDAVMARCAVGVVASLGSEELSRACLEWMAMGRPVVATMVGCLPELVEPEETGVLVPPDDPGAMAEGIRRILADAALRDRWGRGAHRVAQTRFSDEAMRIQTDGFYRSFHGVGVGA